jgi:DNA-binding GntR family transcriptional regulator
MPRKPSPTLTLKVANKLRWLILAGDLTPGARLRQIEIADQFEVSPTPVREAFKTLAEEGLVTYDTRRGVVVFTPTVDDVLENYAIRLALEPLATELAAEAMTEDDLAKLDDIVLQMRETDSSAVYQGLNREFHALIYESAGLKRLAQIINSLRDAFEVYVRLFTTLPDRAYDDQVRNQHEEIAAAIHAREPKQARKMMGLHLETNRTHIAEAVEGSPE